MIKRLLLLFVLLSFSIARAQTIKTDVLVVGGGPSGVSAAIQSARSKVKTILMEQSSRLCPNLQDAVIVPVNANRYLSCGIWDEFRSRVREYEKKSPGYDTAYNAPLKFEDKTGIAILTNIADTVKNLDIKLNTYFVSIKKDDDKWDVNVMENGVTETIKTRVVIDATESNEVIKKAGATSVQFDILQNTSGLKTYRTSIAMSDDIMIRPDTLAPQDNYPRFPAYCIPMKTFIAQGADNLLSISNTLPIDIQQISTQLIIGQGAGVIAAYCAFFKTTTNNLKVRAIQTELLNFKGYLLPFEDISIDPHWRDIQQVCATGMLKGVQKTINGNTEFIFDGDSTVTAAEIKPVMLEIYTRSFLWFNKEKPGKDFTISNLLSFISEITLNDPDNLQKTIARDWNAKYNFKPDFDLDKPVTRREFAILVNKYLNPFARTIDLDGRVIN